MQERALALIIILDPMNSGHRPFFSYLNIGCFHGFVPKLHTSCRTWIKNNFHQTVYRYMLWYRNSITTSERNQFLTPWVYLSSLFSQSNDAKFRPCYLLWGCPHAFSSNTKSDKEDGRWRTDGWCRGKEGAKEILIRTKERQGASSQMWISSSGPTNLRVTALGNDNLWQ